jgi:hypothetical protein
MPRMSVTPVLPSLGRLVAAWLAMVGVVFSAVLPPHLALARSSDGVVLELCTHDGFVKRVVDPATGLPQDGSAAAAGPCLACGVAPSPTLLALVTALSLPLAEPAAPPPPPAAAPLPPSRGSSDPPPARGPPTIT